MAVTGTWSIEVDAAQMAAWKLLSKRDQKNVLTSMVAWYYNKQRSLVRRGLDTHGKRFLPLSRRYRDLKRRAGRYTGGHFLRLSGEMFRSQKHKIKRRGKKLEAVVEFAGTRSQYTFKSRGKGQKGKGDLNLSRKGKKVSSALVAAANDKIRPFVGVSPKSLSRMTRLFARKLDKLSKRGGS